MNQKSLYRDATNRTIMRGTTAKLSLDMLVGLSIFLLSFFMISNFIVGLFGDVRSEISLSGEAYKVSVILAEMSGKWSNGTANGTDWENHWNDPDVVFLPGLAVKPCELSYSKIIAFRKATQSDYEKIKMLLGLKTPDADYDFHVSLETINSTPFERELLLNFSSLPVLDVGKEIPQTQVARYERIVWLDNCTDVANPTLLAGRCVAKLVVVVW